MKPSELYKRDIEALTFFRDSYVELLNATKVTRPMFIAKLVPAVGNDEWQRLRAQVAAAAGNAGPAYRRHGVRITLHNAAYVTRNLDPVLNWDVSLKDPEQLDPETIISAVDTATGLAQRQAEEAAGREKGITGLIAGFLRWPSDLRAAVGPDHGAQQKAAGVVGVVLQTAVGGALATVLVALGVVVWRAILVAA